MKPVRTAARALLGAFFVANGARAVANPEQHVDNAKLVTDRLTPLLESTDPRLPTDPRTLIRINGAVQVIGGLLLARGQFRRPAAAALAASLVPTTLANHPFWTKDNPERTEQESQFLKNLGLLGGLLLAAVDTEGRPSLRYRASTAAGRGRRSAGRTAYGARRAVRTARREAKIAVVSAGAARRLPG